MSKAKYLLVFISIVFLSACSCKTGRVGPGNIPLAEAGSILKDINFEFDSYALSARAKGLIENNYRFLEENENVIIKIEGHCDSRGTNEYNMVLGANRARAVYDYLRSLGLSQNRASTISYGEELPLVPGNDESAWSQNRRVHFEIIQ
ncbi:UNVERIFIED_CONTAM: hypothetical protein GTU68_028902 [Idotea baltica]|nr:hypothetical protein [Idotea baltica]